MNYRIGLPALLSLWLLSGCFSSRLVYSWQEAGTAQVPFKKIMVVALIPDKDRRLQEQMEDHLVNDLASLGYEASSSLKEMGPNAFNKSTEEEVLDKLKNSGVDGVMTIVLLDKSRERYYVPGQIMYTPYRVYHGRFYGYYSTLYDRIYSPGYYEYSTRYFWESNLFDLSGKKLLYTAQTESFDPENASSMGHEYSLVILKDMIRKQLLSGTVEQLHR